MGNAAVAEDLVGVEELEELYKLFASETAPEDDEDDDDYDDDEEEGDEEEPAAHPEGMPHE